MSRNKCDWALCSVKMVGLDGLKTNEPHNDIVKAETSIYIYSVG